MNYCPKCGNADHKSWNTGPLNLAFESIAHQCANCGSFATSNRIEAPTEPSPWFTEGPWTYHGNIVNAYRVTPTVNVARCSGLSPAQAEANARLMAAAPELLDALQSVLQLDAMQSAILAKVVAVRTKCELAIRNAVPCV